MKLSVARPTKINAAVPSAKKGTIQLINVADILAMPQTDALGIACIDDFGLEPTAEFQYLYLTPTTQKFEINPDGDADSRLFRKKIFGSYPGNELEIFQFIKQNINCAFVAIYKECGAEYSKIFGSKTNPLFVSPNYKDDSSGKTYEISLEQNNSDDVPILFYNGGEPVIVDTGLLEIEDLTQTVYDGSYKPRKIYLVSAEPNLEELEFFNFPVIFRICGDGKSNDVTYDLAGNRYDGASTILPDEIISLGEITSTSNQVILSLPASGINSVRINNHLLSKDTADEFTFTAVTAGSLKSLIIYAKDDPQIFYLAEGVEGSEAITPEYDGLFIAGITVSDSGQIVDDGSETGIKLKADDGWKTILLNSDSSVWLPLATPQSSFEILTTGLVTAPKVKGVNTKSEKNIWNGKRILVRNNSALAVVTEIIDLLPVQLGISYITFATVETLKPGIDYWFSIKENKLQLLKTGGGASFPESGSDGDILTKDSSLPDGVKWDKSLKNSIDAEIVNRAMQDAVLSGRIDGKLDKPTTDGIFAVKKAGSVYSYVAVSGDNISNADLSNVSERIFTQGNIFTWNTGGFGYFWKGLYDRTGNGAYTKVVVVHPTTGETVTRDFADPAATTLAVQNANTTQKTAMRTALLGTAVPASPTINNCFPSFVKKGESTYVDLVGLNLTLLDPSFIFIQKLDGTKIYATNFYNRTTQILGTTWLIPLDMPQGDYEVKIQNGVALQGLSTGILKVIDNYTKIDLLPSNWRYITQDITIVPSAFDENILGVNYLKSRVPVTGTVALTEDNSSGLLWMTNNFIKKEKNYAIVFTLSYLDVSTLGTAAFPFFFGLSPTNSADVSTISSFVKTDAITANYSFLDGNTIRVVRDEKYRIEMIKTGNTLNYKLFNESGILLKQRLLNLNPVYDYCLYVRETAQRSIQIHEFIFDIKEL